jgi:short-subunit dehydrogenase
MNLKKQTQRSALITGSTRGIGKETALLLLQKELNVIISPRSQQSVDNVIQEIHGKFPSKYMLENKSGSIIINVSSGAGKSGFPNLSAYCASKFGVIGFTESIANEVADNNVKVMTICPGRVDTKMIEDIIDNGYTLSNRKLMKPEQVANKIYDMISNQKDYYNGQSIEFYNK